MAISIPAFAVILLGIVFYCWFLRTQQRRLIQSVEMLERLREQAVSTRISDERAA
jgi:hypothetical protein